MSEFDLKKSEKIGQLYPVLVDAKGNIIDGNHRLEADPNWRKEKIPEIDTEEKLLVARCVSNWHRRPVSREEKANWINGLAALYEKQGLKTGAGGYGVKNEIRQKIVEVTGLSQPVVNSFLLDKYKARVREDSYKPPILSASERIEHELGRDYVERHRIEVEEELRPKVEKEIRERILEEEIKPKVKEELRRDTEFITNLPEKTFGQQQLTFQEEEKERLKKTDFQKQSYLKLKEPLSAQYQHQREWNLKQLVGQDFSNRGTKFQFDFVTLGYSQKTIQNVVTSLKLAGVTLLIDIRRNPVSMYKPEFNKETIEETLRQNGIDYRHMPELGISRDARNAVYEGKITGEALVELKELTRGHRTFALMCTEVNPLRCHRHKIAELLFREGKVGFDL